MTYLNIVNRWKTSRTTARTNQRKTKYRNVKTEIDGILFDSKLEAKRYSELNFLKKAGAVLFFLRQVPFHLPGGVTYRCDFLVFWKDGSYSVEDVKGRKTRAFIDKQKMVEALYPIKIELIYYKGK